MSAQRITALVCGMSAGLGAEFCRQFAGRCDVIIGVARQWEPLHAMARELEGQVEWVPVKADLGTVEGCARTLEALRQRGPVDYLVNVGESGTCGKFHESAIGAQRECVSLRIDATITLCRGAVRFMLERGSGHIINVSSVAALLPTRELAVCGAAGAFINHFSQALQAELANTGVEIQALCSGYGCSGKLRDSLQGDIDAGTMGKGAGLDPAREVAASLAALGTGKVLVIPGEYNQSLARLGLQRQSSAVQ